jgi:20S proteasome alpha/beta subunit
MRRFAASGSAGDARNLARFFRIEAALQHRRDELHPLSVVLQTARDGLLVGADTDMVDVDA